MSLLRRGAPLEPPPPRELVRFAQLWASMSLSPPQSPAPSTPPTEPVTTRALCDDAFALSPTGQRSLDSAVHTWEVSEEQWYAATLVWFEQQQDARSASATARRMSRRSVIPKPVYVNELAWAPMIDDAGCTGHAYRLALDGAPVAVIEVSPDRIAVVQQSYSPLSVVAGLVSPATRLVFGPQHPAQLRALIDEVEQEPDEIVYTPNTEMLVGRGIDRLLLLEAPVEAREVWQRTRSFLASMNRDVLRGIRVRNGTEFRTAEVSPREIAIPNIEGIFV